MCNYVQKTYIVRYIPFKRQTLSLNALQFHYNEFKPVSTTVTSSLNIFKLYLASSYLTFSYVINISTFSMIEEHANFCADFCKPQKCLLTSKEFIFRRIISQKNPTRGLFSVQMSFHPILHLVKEFHQEGTVKNSSRQQYCYIFIPMKMSDIQMKFSATRSNSGQKSVSSSESQWFIDSSSYKTFETVSVWSVVMGSINTSHYMKTLKKIGKLWINSGRKWREFEIISGTF